MLLHIKYFWLIIHIQNAIIDFLITNFMLVQTSTPHSLTWSRCQTDSGTPLPSRSSSTLCRKCRRLPKLRRRFQWWQNQTATGYWWSLLRRDILRPQYISMSSQQLCIPRDNRAHRNCKVQGLSKFMDLPASQSMGRVRNSHDSQW